MNLFPKRRPAWLLGVSVYAGVIACMGLASLLAPRPGDAADLSQSDRDFDVDFESDDILALNMSAASKSLARSLGFRLQVTQPLRNLRLWLVKLRAPPGMNARAALERLRASDPKGFYGINESYSLAEAPSACEGVRCYGMTMVGWDQQGCPIKARIGMVDSAVNVDAPALARHKIAVSRFSPGKASAAEKGHGSAIASMLVGSPAAGIPGLLPQARLFAADVFSRDAAGRLTTNAARITGGLDWLAGHKPVVVNMSIEGPDSNILRVAIQRLLEEGVAIVAAAGNHGPTAPPQYPGAFPGVIAVTAVDRFEQVYVQANQGTYVGLAAPGVGIWTADADGGASLKNGTSFAAPFVTAAIAQVRTQDPELSPAAAVALLRDRARDLGTAGSDPIFGAGLLQAPGCGAMSAAARE